MELIRTRQIVRSHDGEPLFGPLDLVLSRGQRLGLVGPNASGKSALLDTLAGLVAPDSGSLRRALGVRVGYLAQTVGPVTSGADVWQVASGGLAGVREAERRMRAAEHRLTHGAQAEQDYAEAIASFEGLGGYGAEAELLRALAAVGFGSDRLGEAADRLSGGERRRLALATALAGTPEVLLLDEPTNHLDLAMRRWLGARLARWPGALVVVSHDRALLDATTGSTLFLGSGASELRRGAYTRANAARQQGLGALRKRSKEREREAERLRAMARELASFGGRGAHRRRRVAERRAEALTARNDASGQVRSAAETGTLSMETRGLRGLLLEARHLRRDGVIDVALLRLHAGEHVALLGPNGSGKTTLLLMLAGVLASDDPRSDVRTPQRLRLALVGQLDRGLEAGTPIIDQLERLALPQRARDLLVQAGLGPASWDRPPEQLSGGQRARAGLALLTAREADVLLLDEPSNDLDLAGVEALEQALRSSRAAIVLATHDQRLAEALRGPVWGIDGGALERYGDVAGYLAGKPSRARQGTGDGERSRIAERAVDVHNAAGAAAGPESLVDEVGATADGDGDDAAMPADPDPSSMGFAGPGDASFSSAEPSALALIALEDERRLIEDVLMDPLRLSERERDRLETKRADLDDALGEAYEARMPPPFPRFHVRENGLGVVADRTTDGLVVLLPFPDADGLPVALAGGSSNPYDGAARAATATTMATLLRALAETERATPDGSTSRSLGRHGLPASVPRTLPWVLVRRQAQVAHLALFEPFDACLLPYARTALVEGAARFTFTLTNATALQLFCSEPLPTTRLLHAGGGWWSWSRDAFEQAEGWPAPASVSRRQRRRRRPERQGSA